MRHSLSVMRELRVILLSAPHSNKILMSHKKLAAHHWQRPAWTSTLSRPFERNSPFVTIIGSFFSPAPGQLVHRHKTSSMHLHARHQHILYAFPVLWGTNIFIIMQSLSALFVCVLRENLILFIKANCKFS